MRSTQQWLPRGCALIAASLLVGGTAAAAEPPALVADGPVQATVADGPRVYVGGGFDYIGPATGPAQTLDGVSGSGLGAPRIDGPVLAAVADGAGGWFVGGEFSRVGRVARASLAHILPDGRVDPAWAPPVSGVVLALALSGRTLYVGGNFSSVGGRSRNRLAAVDAVTGEVVAGFDPDVGFGGVALGPSEFPVPPRPPRAPSVQQPQFGLGLRAPRAPERCFEQKYTNFFVRTQRLGVEALAADGERVYIGGSFTSVSGFERQHLAALDAATGQVDESFDPDATTPGRNPRALSRRAETNGPVKTLLLAGERLYVGGSFTSAVGRSRSRLAAFDARNGELVSGFDAAADGEVRALAAAGDRLYVGGAFRKIGAAPRRNLAAVDTATGAPRRDFDAQVGGTVGALAVAPDRLYVGGRFNTVGPSERPKLAAVALDSGELMPGFQANADSAVATVAAAGGRVFAGGFFVSIGGLVRHGLAVLDTRRTAPARLRGQPRHGFAPSVPMSVRALALGGRRLYASGFRDGARRGRIVAFDRSSGRLEPEFRAPRGAPNRLLVAGDRIYVAGSGVVAGTSGPLAALNHRSGARDRSFSPSVRGIVEALARAPGGVYAGGALYTSAELERAHDEERPPRGVALWRLRRDGSRVRKFRPPLPRDETSIVSALAAGGGRVYASGSFRTVGAERRRNLVALRPRSGALIDEFDPPPLGGSVLELAGPALFVSRPGGARRGVARLDSRTGRRAARFRGRVRGSVCGLALADGVLAVGGGFLSLNGRPYENVGLIDLAR